MRRTKSELNIFSMSALDLFASAMGAFLLIAVIMMPYYKKQMPVPDPQECPVVPEPVICPEPGCKPCPKAKIKDNFIVFAMLYEGTGDIDLHIIDPSGNEFYYERKTFTGVPGALTYDIQNGPGVEIWEIIDPEPGTYTVYYKLFSGRSNHKIDGRLYKATGRLDVRSQTMRQEGVKRLVAKFKIDADGVLQPLYGF